jgi:hypothetical protein
MQLNSARRIGFFMLAALACGLAFTASAQVNAVEFGRNRLQFKKFKWQYYQTKNFNVYFYQNGQELAKYVAQVAEKELPSIENEAEYSLQRRANIILYNHYADMQQSNIGLEQAWQTASGITKLVNNKMVVYFDANHYNLRRQIRQGIAKVITDNDLFGEGIGEIAGNQALLDLPEWMTDGYIAYLGENWSTELDDALKNELLSGKYRKFTQLAFDEPLLAGHAFWYYIEERYKKESVRKLLYLSKVYKNLNKACLAVCKKKLKNVLSEFMDWNQTKYDEDINRRRPYPKGSLIETFEVGRRTDYYRFNVNPNKRNFSYVMTQYRKGIVRVIYYDDDKFHTLLKFGIRNYKNEVNPNYPMMAWDPKGTRIAVIYTQEGRLKMFIYDVVTRIKQYKLDLTDKFDQIQDMKYMLDSKTLLFSAVKNGHTDIFTFDAEKEKEKAITNDVYDDLDPSFVAFPGKTGILFSSNRPDANTRGGDTSIPSNNHFNVFLITDFGDKPELNQATQLTKLKFGNARYPTQYNQNHFTFINDENGIGNRYAGFFTTTKEGLDTLVLIGSDILRNPSVKEVDSTLRANKQTDVDSIAVVSISRDSAYTFPLTNYESSVLESRIAGDNNQVSEVTRQSYEKELFKLKIDENTLRRRNVTARPTTYMKRLITADRMAGGQSGAAPTPGADTDRKVDDVFQNEFANEKADTTLLGSIFAAGDPTEDKNVLKKAKLFPYKPPKFYAESGSAGFNNNVLVNRFQAYAGGSGPIQLNSNTPLNALIRLGTSELMEDVKILGGYRLSTNLKDNEWLLSYQNYKRRLDWGLTFYRNVLSGFDRNGEQGGAGIFGKTYTQLYQVNVSWPFDASKSIRLITGIRSDNFVPGGVDVFTLKEPSSRTLYSTTHMAYVYDNTLNPALNIWNGLRYKIFFDWNRQINKVRFADGPTMFNLGADVRYYYPIFRNFIWAGRAAADISWGNQKTIYYLGGTDGWLQFGGNEKADGSFRYFNPNPQPAPDNDYAFQSLAVNMRGFIQNIANGNNAVVLNSEFRLPIFSTFINRPINNAFLRNLQVVQFVDLGTAWNGQYGTIKRPVLTFGDPTGVQVIKKAGGVGPFAGGYGFGVRSSLLGYFLRFDVAWQMNGVFKGKPLTYLSMGLDF